MVSAGRDEPLVPTVGIKLNQQPLVSEMALWIVRVIVEDDLEFPSMFSLEMISKEDADGIFPWTDDERLVLGAAVEISMGYGDHRETLIVGEITALEPTFSISGAPTLTVRGYDKRHRLNAAPGTYTYTSNTDSEIAEQVCARVNVPIKATRSDVKHEHVFQADHTDLEFLRHRAKHIDYEVAVAYQLPGIDDGTLLFRPNASGDKSAVRLSLSDDLLEFRPRLALVPMTAVQVLAWDVKQKLPIKASAKAGDEVSTMDGLKSAAQLASAVFGTLVERVVRAPVYSQAEADRLAFSRYNAAALDLIHGDGRIRGRTDVRAGAVIALADLGKRFSGEYYVTSATHSYSRHEGYITDFQVKRNAS